MSDAFDCYESACADYEQSWQILDESLYDLCRRHPGHAEPSHVNAKLWIVGRTFASGIERKIPSDRTQGSSLHRVAQLLVDNHRDVDAMLGALRTIEEPLTPDALRTIIAEHGRLDRLLRTITRKNQSVRSFTSKYMHFHCPAVPIYDSLACASLRRHVRWKDSLLVLGDFREGDDQYRWHVLRFWKLYQDLLAAEKHVTVRLVDQFLLW